MKVLLTGELQLPFSKSDFQNISDLVLRELQDAPEYQNFADTLGKPKKVEVHFCDDVEMRGYQKKFRRLDRTTDILSFPALESPAHSERGFLGSLIISLASVERNAKRYRRRTDDELLEVFIHGLLHLLSFDHVKVDSSQKPADAQAAKNSPPCRSPKLVSLPGLCLNRDK